MVEVSNRASDRLVHLRPSRGWERTADDEARSESDTYGHWSDTLGQRWGIIGSRTAEKLKRRGLV